MSLEMTLTLEDKKAKPKEMNREEAADALRSMMTSCHSRKHRQALRYAIFELTMPQRWAA